MFRSFSLLCYFHEFSRGQKQRIDLARTMILKPRLIMLDETTSSLNVSKQAQIIHFLRHLQLKYHLSYLFMSHALKAVKAFSYK
ncbi:ATP-binding cassette domain-containing protein [Bartonella sp. ML70XJBT.G]|uniref:ATP-binding cassette domain-containing protein n=1 Tax=Bartonella sp. ML70XJBT.G TaxID=3019093 RepID=UPI0023612D2B|nr:ATP-binding cassette domain-containing protein [Bartonella sp. ML70XJBT.G]